jgi:hypothetical protein
MAYFGIWQSFPGDVYHIISFPTSFLVFYLLQIPADITLPILSIFFCRATLFHLQRHLYGIIIRAM